MAFKNLSCFEFNFKTFKICKQAKFMSCIPRYLINLYHLVQSKYFNRKIVKISNFNTAKYQVTFKISEWLINKSLKNSIQNQIFTETC